MTSYMQSLVAGIMIGCSMAATAQVEDTDAARLAARFQHLAGTEENAMALVLALRNGSTVQLASSATARVDAVPDMVALVVPTPPMAWNDVRITLLNTQDQLVRAGIMKPSLEQLHAALLGGEITTVEGAPMVLRGVLQLRAEGLSWLDIARASDALPAARRVSGSR